MRHATCSTALNYERKPKSDPGSSSLGRPCVGCMTGGRGQTAASWGDWAMKVVLFCGGMGMRMRDGLTNAPKPMAMIGDRPLLWHVMRYYAHYGHRDFVLCLGYGASAVKDFFLTYDETRSNDFVLQGAGQVELFKTDISDWRITFIDTGLHSEIGERLRRVRRFVDGEDMFLANYADVFTDAPLPDMIARFAASDATAGLLA